LTRTRKIIMVDDEPGMGRLLFCEPGSGSDAKIAFLFLLM
jgi:hypothetical protein